MKVMKFGGSSLADAERYLRVRDIVLHTHTEKGAAVVLSAPKGVTNALSLLVEQAVAGDSWQELFEKLNMTLTGIVKDLARDVDNFGADPLFALIDEKLLELKQSLEGIHLIHCSPDAVTAKLLSIGEYVSVNIFSAIVSATGVSNQIIDPVEYVLAEGDYLDSIADVAPVAPALPTCRKTASRC